MATHYDDVSIGHAIRFNATLQGVAIKDRI